ncbi:protein translocase subunit SecD [Eggerthellaceae bacterium zg-1084]|uniref:Multifunctional fusion protein n=1 Tax=Berryella wangjianweii TaxID=2734634 RepID=A0A6M8J1N4_9ACTN|nr:protein translocase subunit SecD [Berryella wangjianweii]NPD31104.1 protein translocase subunit SecD [Berryella wangjianweii]NPD31966.1 protein translocase subunit SecD [Eggerthellaceae bacterium zg-997]QKF07444.1 protein translocase subunit SecD [Berryella wangjianweii]
MAIQSKASGKKKTPAGNHRRNIWLLVVTALLVLASVFAFTPPDKRINQGLDIQGGLSVVLTATSTDGQPISREEMETSRSIIESRVNALGASEAVVQRQGTNQILVQIPGLTNTAKALETIGKTGKLTFARLDSFTDPEVRKKIESGNFGESATVTDDFGNRLPAPESGLKVKEGDYTPLITGANITGVNVGRESETSTKYAVNVSLDAEGTQAFAEATTKLAPSKGKIVIILDGEVQSAPAVQSAITGGKVSITGGYTLDGAKGLATVLESGSLPVSFQYSQSQVVGPTLGQGALASGVVVALAGLALVMIYLLLFYRGLGLITASAMVVFAVFYLGVLATLSHFGLFSLSLSGVAGIVLTIGMAADSSVLTVERFREEVRMGRSVRASSITGVRHAITTSIDADLVTLVSALSLFFLASASVKGFGLTLALGIICDIIMMLLFKAPLIRVLAPRVIARHPGFWDLSDSQRAHKAYENLAAISGVTTTEAEIGEAMNRAESERVACERSDRAPAALEAVRKLRGLFIKHDIGFMSARKVFLSVAALMMVASLALVGVKGLSFGIEFVGGTSITLSDTEGVTSEQVNAALKEAGISEATVQTTEADGREGFLIRMTETDAQKAGAVADAVAEKLGVSSDGIQVSTIGPDWGESVVRASLIAFGVSLILIIVYIAIRFEYKMGVTAVIALLHDLVLVMGVYALMGREITPNTIAALLTILGYSLYDTVVVFHRINDNMKSLSIKCTFMTMANHSVNQVFIRTLNTTLTSIIPVIAMLLFGGETLQDFAFAMVIGLLAGSYSSIAVATPLFAIWKSREPRYAKLAKKYGPKVGVFEFDRSEAVAVAVGATSKAARRKSAEAQAAQVNQAEQSLAEGASDASGLEAGVASASAEAAASPARSGGKKRRKRKR